MSRSPIQPLSAGATSSEALSLLHQRLLVAEEQAEALIRDVGSLGVSRDQLLEHIVGSRDHIRCSVSPLKTRCALGGEAGGESVLWRQCDSLVSRVCRLESLLQTLKLTTFRLETERQLDPSHTARLKEQMAALQQESEEEQRSSRREVMRLREQLRQACEEREEARGEVQRLGEALEVTTASKMDVALAAEELKMVKVQMSEKLLEMRDQMRLESAMSFEAVRSHSELLQRVEETERVVEMERRQAQLVQADCHALRSEGQSSRQRLQEEQEKARRLEEHCQQLREQTEVKDSLVSELKSELKSVQLAFQKQQKENRKMVKESGELRTAAEKVQALNDQLESQCCELSSALRSLTVENARLQSEHHASLKAEKSRVFKQLQEQDLLLEAARHNIQAELQRALSVTVRLQMELEKLRADHAQLLQTSMVAQETAATQKELLERTIERLREEQIIAKNQDGSKYETRVRELQAELKALRETKEASPFKRNRDKLCDPEAWQGGSGPGGSVVSQTLENVLASHSRLQLNSQALQQDLGGREQELATLKKNRVRAEREIRRHQAEVEKLQDILTSTRSKNNRALESLRKALDMARLDNRKLAQSLEQAVMTNCSLQNKLDEARDQNQNTVAQRGDELREARTKIGNLSEELDSLKRQARKENESSRRSLNREISELRKSLEDASARSGDLSRANRELRERVSQLEKQVSNQRARIREQKSQRRQQHLDNGATTGSSTTQRIKDMETELKSLEALKNEYQRKNYEQGQVIQQYRAESQSLQRELLLLSSSLQGALGDERELRHTLQDNCQKLAARIRKLQDEKEEVEQKLREARTESLQITVNPEEAHSPRFKSKFDGQWSPGEDLFDNTDCSPGSSKDGAPTSSKYDTKAPSRGAHTEPEWERWSSTIQRWETKKELARIAGGYKAGQTQSLTQSH